jgi:hypothetical protein
MKSSTVSLLSRGQAHFRRQRAEQESVCTLLRNCFGTAAHVARSSRVRCPRAAPVSAASVNTMPQFHAMLVMRAS